MAYTVCLGGTNLESGRLELDIVVNIPRQCDLNVSDVSVQCHSVLTIEAQTDRSSASQYGSLDSTLGLTASCVTLVKISRQDITL